LYISETKLRIYTYYQVDKRKFVSFYYFLKYIIFFLQIIERTFDQFFNKPILIQFQNVILSAIFTSVDLKTDNFYTVSALAQRLTYALRVIKTNI
jgi:hypothetical protein